MSPLEANKAQFKTSIERNQFLACQVNSNFVDSYWGAWQWTPQRENACCDTFK